MRGRVFFDGKPCTNAVVRLHPLDRPAEGPLPVKVSAKAKGPQFISPRGDVDEKGEFQLTTFDTFDGAPEGRYAVTISWKDPEGRGGDDSDKYPELLPARFQDSRLSGLSVTIDPGDSDEIVLADFQLNP
ncbi:MAG: hypothetical protein HY290_10455 [Planctomycetia bacterium]|nr:hypothetical protein [Planctomycetia bacterium]